MDDQTFFGRLRKLRDEAEARFRNLAGTTATVTFDAFAITYWMAWLAGGIVRQWHSKGFHGSIFAAIAEFPVQDLYTVAVAAAWTLTLIGWTRYIRIWPWWWALPYVLLLLGPMAWFLSTRVPYGIDALILVSLQLPIILGAAYRSRSRSRKDKT